MILLYHPDSNLAKLKFYDPEENINLIHDQREELRNVINDLHQKIIGQMRTIEDNSIR